MSDDQLIIEKMGQLAEGVATVDGKPVFVPYALPGEVVAVRRNGPRVEITRIETASPERATPFCSYFGRCGGCATQHWQGEPYRAWKRGLVVTALSFEGLAPPIDDLIDAHGAGRRRAKFHIRFVGGKAAAGFMAGKTHDLIDIESCPILVPALGEATVIAREIGDALRRVRKPLSVQFTATRSGIDADITGAGAIDFETRLHLTELAARRDLARLSLHGDIVVERRQPVLRFGKVDVAIPPGGFTQATASGEDTLAALVAEGVGDAKAVADLFCGAGPFAVRLAERASVHAVDSEAAGVAALKRAANLIQGMKPVTTELRDLFRRPLLPAELKRYHAVVFDPPRAGAEAQARELAQSSVGTIVAVSCNAATFARDAGILSRGGYRLERVTPVDQFKWSPHLELVAVFRR